MKTEVRQLPKDRSEEAVAVLCESFFDYPVMRYIIGPEGDSYDEALATLIRFFVAARFWRQEPVLVIEDEGRAVAVAILTPPVQEQAPAELAEIRERTWQELGQEARGRYDVLGSVWQGFDVAEPHFHLNMIGVRSSFEGKALGVRLLDAVHEMSRRDSRSHGVALTTEVEKNVSLYRHFSYGIVGHSRISPELETWVMFRSDR